MIEDFYRLSSDAVRYYPKECISSSLSVPIFTAALSALTLQQVDPLIATLHYYHDLFSFAFERPAISEFTSVTQADKTTASKLLKQHNWNVGAAANA